MKYPLLIFLAGLIASCGSVRVNYDYDKESDFSNYSTYNYFSDLDTGLSELDNKRLLNSLHDVLQMKGMAYSEDPDFLIDIRSSFSRAPQNTSVGVGLGGGGRNVGGGLSMGIPLGQSNLKRHIQFDFIDAKSDRLFWQANSQSTFKENLSPKDREQKIAELVQKVLEGYPPKARN